MGGIKIMNCLDWEKLLSFETLGKRDELPKQFADFPMNEFEHDYEQIISSSAFRRLQDKTQVFPLDKSDFIRTRLTHSIEVSTIARQLGLMLINNTKEGYCGVFNEDDCKITEENITSIPSILSCAGLLHDIGNPPFGHFGEDAIGDWFKKAFKNSKLKYVDEPVEGKLNAQMRKDLENFEGNAQALRMLTKVYANRFNLSYAVLNTLIKYPTDSCSFSKDMADIKKHKLGYYYSEKKVIEDICKFTGTKMGDEYVRHPLTYLLEAADDIAYATADVEDAVKKGLFSVEQFADYYSEAIKDAKEENVLNELNNPIINYDERLLKDLNIELENAKESKESKFRIFQNWINRVKRWLMYAAVYRFYGSYEEIMQGKYTDDLFKGTNNEYTIKILKCTMVKFVYSNSEILKLELAAKKIITSLLDDFIPAVIYWDEEEHKDKFSTADSKYIDLISSNLREEFKANAPKEVPERLYLKFLMVTDFISGMTDSYAKGLYRDLNGI